MRAAILIAAIIAMTLVAVWVAGAPVQSNDCWVLPQYKGNFGDTEAQDLVIVKCSQLKEGHTRIPVSENSAPGQFTTLSIDLDVPLAQQISQGRFASVEAWQQFLNAIETTGISVPTYGVVVRADGCTVNPCR